MAFYKHVRAYANGLKTNDITEDYSVIGLQSLGGRAAYRPTIYSILEITAAVSFAILQRNDSVSWCTIFGTEIQFLKNLYIICRQSVLQVGI